MKNKTSFILFLSLLLISRIWSMQSALLGAATMIAYNPQLQSRLVEMARLDQDIREKWIASPDEEHINQATKFDECVLNQLEAIVTQYGWPGFILVNEDGSEAIWLLVQHTPNLSFQKKCLLLLEEAVRKQDASPIHLAYLKDRVLVREGKDQIYGTQAKILEGRLVIYPIEDADHVDARRLTIGLCPLQEYKRQLSGLYTGSLSFG